MSQFAKASFDVAGYLACRPTYPARLYEIITAYHKANNTGRSGGALDLGCGPGFMALNLAPSFEHVTALDPSAKMVSIGLQPDNPKKHITYRVGSAEDLSSIPEQSIDLVVAGQAAHWFDHQRVWSSIGRVLRPGGTVAYVGYGEMFFPSHPVLNRLITAHQGTPHSGIGPYWSQPGRRIVEGLLDAVPFPVEPALTDATAEVLCRLPNLYDNGYPVPERISEPAPVSGSSGWDAATAVRIKKDNTGRQWVLQPPNKKWDWTALEGYFRTSSALHAFQEKHPEDKAKIGGGENGDIIDRLVHQIRLGLREEMGTEPAAVEVAFPLVLMMVKKEV